MSKESELVIILNRMISDIEYVRIRTKNHWYNQAVDIHNQIEKLRDCIVEASE